jgi:hypothetical protein
MQSYVQTARQKKTLDELLEWAATVEGPLAAAAANAEIKRRELMAHFEIITLQREALNIQKQAAESQRDAAIEMQRTAEYTKETAFYMNGRSLFWLLRSWPIFLLVSRDYSFTASWLRARSI